MKMNLKSARGRQIRWHSFRIDTHIVSYHAPSRHLQKRIIVPLLVVSILSQSLGQVMILVDAVHLLCHFVKKGSIASGLITTCVILRQLVVVVVCRVRTIVVPSFARPAGRVLLQFPPRGLAFGWCLVASPRLLFLKATPFGIPLLAFSLQQRWVRAQVTTTGTVITTAGSSTSFQSVSRLLLLFALTIIAGVRPTFTIGLMVWWRMLVPISIAIVVVSVRCSGV